MNTQVNPMLYYCMKPNRIEAVEVDKEWLHYLTKEKGFSQVKLGDMYVKGNDGDSIWAKERFLRVFELAPDDRV